MLLQLSHFPPFTPRHPAHLLPPSHIPPLSFMSVGHTYKFFGFYISNFFGFYYSYRPPVYFLPIIYATYSLYLSPLSPRLLPC